MCLYIKEHNGKCSFPLKILHLTRKLKHSPGNELGFYDFWTGEGVTSRDRKGRSCDGLVILQHSDRIEIFISINKYLVPTMCHVLFETLGKHSQPPKHKNTKTTQNQKYQQTTEKPETKPWDTLVRHLTRCEDSSLENSGSTLFSQFKFWCQSEITRCPWLYYRIQLSVFFGENLKSIVTFRREPFSAGVMSFGAREPSGSGTLFSFNTALGRKYKFTSWRTCTGIEF